MATETETDKGDVRLNFLVFELFLVLTLKPLIANLKIANFDGEAENNWSQLRSCYACKLYIGTHRLVSLVL